jgi:hypothetical protein
MLEVELIHAELGHKDEALFWRGWRRLIRSTAGRYPRFQDLLRRMDSWALSTTW